MNARAEVLDRVRRALGPDPEAVPVARAYRRAGALAARSPELLDLFAARVADHAATVHRCAGDDAAIAAAVAAALGPARWVVVPPGVPARWTADRSVTVDHHHQALAVGQVDRTDAVVTGAIVAIAETGTFVLDGSPDQGRRALTLVPDHHVCVVLASQVVETVPEALARLDPTRPLTFVSGPSATSDIELARVEGVHGPRVLHVVLAVDV